VGEQLIRRNIGLRAYLYLVYRDAATMSRFRSRVIAFLGLAAACAVASVVVVAAAPYLQATAAACGIVALTASATTILNGQRADPSGLRAVATEAGVSVEELGRAVCESERFRRTGTLPNGRTVMTAKGADGGVELRFTAPAENLVGLAS
jgi:hypothetical protein